MSAMDQVLARRLEEIEMRGLYRRRRLREGLQAVETVVDGRRVINFCSNDYLGLASHPALIEALRDAASRLGGGSGSAHLVCGHSNAHAALERALAEFTGRDRALLFSTGYMANIGVISALVGRGDQVLEDRLNHASLLDGGLLSGARFRRYRHADIAALRRILDKRTDGRTLVVSDAVFSMDGDLAPLSELVHATEASGAWLMIDDAHGLGVLGERGAGTLEQFGLTQQQVPVLIGTLGKAAGTFGAFVAGSEALIEFLIQQARPYLFTTALPPALAEATRAALSIMRTEPWRRQRLQRLIRRFRTGAAALGVPLMNSQTPIQPVLVGEARQASFIAARLFECGFLVIAIRPPTVPHGSARLRITLSAQHSEQQVDRLLEALAETVHGRAMLR